MKLQEIKNTIAAIESSELNIKYYENLKNRELAIIPTDSEYFKEFQEWARNHRNGRYDGKVEQAPLYVKGKSVNKALDLQIQRLKDFAQPHKIKLKAIMTDEES